MKLTGQFARDLLFAMIAARQKECIEIDKDYVCYSPAIWTICKCIDANNVVKTGDVFTVDDNVYHTIYKIDLMQGLLKTHFRSAIIRSLFGQRSTKPWEEVPEKLTLIFRLEYVLKYQNKLLRQLFRHYKIRRDKELKNIISSELDVKGVPFNYLNCYIKTDKKTIDCVLDILEKKLSDEELYKIYGEKTIKKVAECYSDPFVFEILDEKLDKFSKLFTNRYVERRSMELEYERKIDKLRNDRIIEGYDAFITIDEKDLKKYDEETNRIQKKYNGEIRRLTLEQKAKTKQMLEEEYAETSKLVEEIEELRRSIR